MLPTHAFDLEKYRVFDKMLEGVQLIGFDWTYLYANESLARMGRTTIDGMLGRKMTDLYPGLEETEIYHKIQSSRDHKVPNQVITEFQFPDGSTSWFDIRLEPVEEGVFILSFDITEQKNLELELQRMNGCLAKLIQDKTTELTEGLNRERELNVLKTHFVSMASHEFRTPLSTILSSISLIEKYPLASQQDNRVKHTRRIKNAVCGLNATLNDFLSLDKLEEGNLTLNWEVVDLTRYFGEIIGEFEAACKPDQKIDLWLTGHPEAMLDRQLFRNVMINLISNGLKYSDADVDIRASAEPHVFWVEISDRGIGIPETDQQNLFSRFFRAGNAQSIHGTGLGLNIVKQYVELMHGKIECKSRENEGTTFRVWIPQLQEAL